MLLTIHDKYEGNHTIDTHRRDSTVFERGSMIARIAPWSSMGCPLVLEIAITPSGRILHRGWDWSGYGNPYLHVYGGSPSDIIVTPEMCDTVAGLFSGRIKVDELKIAVGSSIQKICPIDLEAEEAKVGHTIYLA